MRLFIRLIAIVLAVAMAVVLFLKFGPWSAAVPADAGASADAVATAGGEPAVDGSAAAPAVPAGSGSTAAPSGPLPPLDAPLAAILPELERRAASGDAAAACRIAAGRASCGWLRAQREHHLAWAASSQRRLEANAATASPEAAARGMREFQAELERRESQLDAVEARCADVPTPTPGQVAADWRRAAQLGSRSAMRLWASGRAIQPNGILDALDELVAYRAEGPAMARQLVAEGDLAMTLALANATAPLSSRSMTLLGQAVEEDPALSLALFRRALAALEGAGDAPGAERLRAQVAERVEVVSGLLPPEMLAEAGRRSLEFAAWQPVDVRDTTTTLDARGQGILALPQHCQAEAGEPLPVDFRIHRRPATPL